MSIYTLYVKIHRKTGLRYLGQTSKDPFKYPGSGVDWSQHLKEFGNDVRTEIIIQTADKNERNKQGRYYSALWHVVTAANDFGDKIWANRIPETGGGGGWARGEDNCMARPDIKSKHLAALNKPEEKKRKSAASKRTMSRPEVKKKLSSSRKKLYENPTRRQKMSDIGSASAIKRIANGSHNLLGSNHPLHDSKIYNFIHTDGRTHSSTKYDLAHIFSLEVRGISRLISRERKSHKGWRVVF